MSEPAWPSFSVVVPTYARERQLADCLAALAALDYPRGLFEVLVVDDGGGLADGAVEPFRDALDLKLIAQQHAGPAAARNTGARAARGELLAFTDDDCRPAPGWLKALAASLRTEPGSAAGGRTVNALEDNPYSAASQSLVDYLYESWNVSGPGGPLFFTSNNFALPASVFRDAGGFDESFPRAAGEDRELCDRLRARGVKLLYAPEAVVLHAHALSLTGFCRQHFNYGRAALHFRRARARRGGGPAKVEPAAFYLNLLRRPFARGEGFRALPLAALLLVSQAANAAGFFYERGRVRG